MKKRVTDSTLLNITGTITYYQGKAMSLKKVLRNLPNSADKIAELLESKNIKGKKDGAQRCPLAIYLNQIILDGEILVGIGYARDTQETTRVKLPDAAIRFVFAFDHGQYPNLEQQ